MDLVVSCPFLDLEIKKPKGVVKGDYRSFKALLSKSFFVTVGDFVSCSAVENGLYPHVMVVDGRVEREKFNFKPPSTYWGIKVVNPRGTVSSRAWRAVREALKIAKSGLRVCLFVEGEEDLMGFPFVILGDFGDKVLYGQPGVGVVLVEVTFEAKKRAFELLSLFDVGF